MIRLIIKGFVQGIGYRSYIKYIADKYGLRGYVRNLDNDKVEVVIDDNKEAIREILSYKYADIKSVEREIVDEQYNDFRIIR